MVRSGAGVRALAAFLRLLERAIPTDGWIDGQIAAERPDIVLVTPLVDLGSDQVEFVKSARMMGIHTGLCVHSWDNLTNKGLIRVLPDRVFVWNELQQREAVEMHGMPPDDVIVTGAPVYDQWFDRQPSRDRATFCATVGLPDDRLYLLYLGSSAFIAPNESVFVCEWLRALRGAADPALREVSIVVRPHPQNSESFQRVDYSEYGPVVVWPRGAADPVDVRSKADYFDSLYHAVAAVGINTSAQIEAGIVDRPVYTVQTAEHAGTQEGTLHFRYLTDAERRLVHSASGFGEHLSQLGRLLAGETDDDGSAARRAFVHSFVRPHGLEVPATPRLAEAIEALGRLPSRGRPRTRLWLYPIRWGLVPFTFAHKVGRLVVRVARGRNPQYRPLTIVGYVLRPLWWVLDALLHWRPARGFVKRYVIPRVMPRGTGAETPAEEITAIPRIVDRLYKSGRLIIVGPWLSEVGFEILYWIPFINWVKTYRPFDPDRLVIVSRGGTALWYGDIGSRYVDVFDFFTPDDYRARNEARLIEGRQKQWELSAFDHEIVKRVKTKIGRHDLDVLHPMYMNRLFFAYWKSQRSVSLIENFAAFTRLPSVDASDIASELPDDYVAVRFYFNDCFPETEENRRFVGRLLTRLTATTDVVLLNPGLHLDDHWDLTPQMTRRLHSIAHLVTPRNNLEIQTKVITRARAFIGNYGGLSYLAPFYGVQSLVFYSNPGGFSVQHLELADRVFAKMKRGSFVALDVQALDVIGLALTGAAGATEIPDLSTLASSSRVMAGPPS